jgi:hypothetical protein
MMLMENAHICCCGLLPPSIGSVLLGEPIIKTLAAYLMKVGFEGRHREWGCAFSAAVGVPLVIL